MEQLNEILLEEVKNHAETTTPEECCGLFISTKDGTKRLPSKNASPYDKKHSFKIDANSLLIAETSGKIIGYYHSHNSLDTAGVFSELDLKNIRIHRLFSLIYNTARNQFYLLDDYNKAKYIGRAFQIGVSDCYSLLQDYFSKELNIKLSDYKRDSKWFRTSPSIWIKNLDKESFSIVMAGKDFEYSKLQPNDVILMFGYDASFPSHGAVFLGNGLILHHPAKKLSTVEFLSSKLIKDIAYIVRHNALWKT